ncbi:nucleotide sugar dehydrogenase [Streptomyces collinus]|uniref:Nucleotide sugar dehydrogenase n=2 Tax=Streptomyces TaxID=1883 RepID=A0AA89Q8H2_STRCU|nr:MULTISPECIES: nucleotide sugar dehydrogenase [Streptomyces]MBB5814515.1 nucleotide sugar dehydrogenase [Streptomyces collinus]MEC7057428.1 nucleotide sugar dehydrogenase [Streptomyces violaceochromogenes]WMX67524.1 nucleotide sugar dehydrogenase [Streptomyces collinus]
MSRSSTVDLVVVGLGYVGLPLARSAAAAGLKVVGLDRSRRVVEGLNAGRSHVDDISDAEVRAMLEQGFEAVDRADVIAGAAAVVVCVPTPLTEHGAPDLGAVHAAVDDIAAHLTAGTLVVLESTTYPGTTDEVVRPRLEAGGLRVGIDFHLAFSPERIDPGNPSFGLENTPKVVGGITADCTKAARALYERFVNRVVEAKGTREAEMAKLLENTYRHVNIALVNEMSMFCREIGVDLWDAIRCASTKPFGFAPFHPGPGVGGHCIPIDPNYLSYKVRSLGIPFRFVELAQEINQRMPVHVVNRAADLLNDQGKAVRGSRVLLLGVTYKPDISDQRESPALAVAENLLARGAELVYFDPRVEDWQVAGAPVERAGDYLAAAEAADLTILLQPHREIDLDELADHARALFDTRGKSADHPRVVKL